MGCKITITIEVDDSGGVSVSTGEDRDVNPAKQSHGQWVGGGEDNFVPEDEESPVTDEYQPFSLAPDQNEIFTGKPEHLTDELSGIMEERANKFANQFAMNMSDNPVIGSAIAESLNKDDVMDAIEESAEEQRNE